MYSLYSQTVELMMESVADWLAGNTADWAMAIEMNVIVDLLWVPPTSTWQVPSILLLQGFRQGLQYDDDHSALHLLVGLTELNMGINTIHKVLTVHIFALANTF